MSKQSFQERMREILKEFLYSEHKTGGGDYRSQQERINKKINKTISSLSALFLECIGSDYEVVEGQDNQMKYKYWNQEKRRIRKRIDK